MVRETNPIFSNRRERLTFAALLLAAFIGVYLFLSGFKNTYIDDAFIQLTYARNLADHGTWGMFPGRTANTATSPLNVLVTAVAGIVIENWLEVVHLLTTLEYVLIFALLLLLSRKLFRNTFFGLFAFAAFLLNPLLLSTIGMESILYTLFLVAALYLYLDDRWALLAVSLGLLTLTRPEGVLFFGIFLLIVRMPVRERWKFVLAYGLTMLPWTLYSWIQLGSLFPDTMIIKTDQGAWGEGISFHNGLGIYFEAFPLATFSSFFLLPFGIFAFWRSERPVQMTAVIVAAYGFLHYTAYWVLGVPPYHWYYTHQIFAIVMVGSLGMAVLVQNRRPLQTWPVRAVAYALLLLPAVGLVWEIGRYGFPLVEAPIHTNWATHAQYKAVGEWLESELPPDTVLLIPMEVGTVSFYADRYLVNEFSSLNMMTHMIENRRYMAWPVVSQVLGVNYLWRDEQPTVKPTYVLRHGPLDALDGTDENLVKTWPAASKWLRLDEAFVVYLAISPPEDS